MARNMCLAINGGTLDSSANEACRDNDFTTEAVASVPTYNYSIINIPSTNILYVKFRMNGSGSGNFNTHNYLDIYYGGGWNTIYQYEDEGRDGFSFESRDTYADDTITGPWIGVTAIRGTLQADGNIGSGSSSLYELQLWGDVGGSFGQII